MSQTPKTLTINSLDRNANSNSTTDFNVNILPAITNAKKFTLASASIPNTTYNVTSTNNTCIGQILALQILQPQFHLAHIQPQHWQVQL